MWLNVALASCIQSTLDGAVLIDVEVLPGSKRQGIIGFNQWRGKLTVAVRAEARNGMANQAVVHVMATSLSLSTSKMHVVSGAKSRIKKVRIEGVHSDHLIEKITTLVEG